MTQANLMLGLHAQTSIHAGTGQNTGVIDLPIQREAHNGWPCVFGSAVKGALRTRAEQKHGAKNDSVTLVFGPDTNNASEHAGALAVSDARLLLFPVRSLTSHFKWVTCPAAIERYCRDSERFEHSLQITDSIEIKDDAAALIPETNETSASDTETLFLEEYQFKTQHIQLKSLIQALCKLMPQAETALQQQLVIVSNVMFAHLVQHGTPVNAHIAIDSETKIVKPGALWYEETLPPETLLYIGLSATQARRKATNQAQKKGADQANKESAEMSAEQVLGALSDLFAKKPWLQLGGNETVGMGWCSVSMLKQGG